VRKVWVLMLGGVVGVSGYGQLSVPPGAGVALKDTSTLKPPVGAKVAIVEFDDLECPPCSRALPLVESSALHYKVPVVHHDFPIWEQHKWALDAAVTARYLKDAVSLKVSQDFRREVFAHQTSIANQEDLAGFTKKWFATHHLKLPAVIDPKGTYVAEVKADRMLGMQVGLRGTPSVFVVTAKSWTQVIDMAQLDATVGKAVVETGKR
jgi:protein-disulfide isomerase